MMQRGFTMVEMLVVLGIVVLIGGALVTFFVSIFSQNAFVQNSLLGQQEAQAALKHLLAEARSAAPSDTGAYAIDTATPDKFTFYSDLDNDGTHERLRYYVQGGTLWRGLLKPTGAPLAYVEANETLSQPVHALATSSLFSFYNANYMGTTTPLTVPINLPEVRLVQINLTVDADPNRPPPPTSYLGQVMIRSLKDNL